MTIISRGNQENTLEMTNTKVAGKPAEDLQSFNKSLHDFSTEKYQSTEHRFSAK